MIKPWDRLRRRTPNPIGVGLWAAGYGDDPAAVEIEKVTTETVSLNISHQTFDVGGLLQLAAFCQELSDQLDG